MIPVRPATNLVLIQRKVATTGLWNPSVSWTENRRVWVSIIPDRGREIFRGSELESVVTHTIRGDFLELEGVTETDRIIYNDCHAYSPINAGSLVFDILAVMPNHDGRNDVMIQANLKSLSYGEMPGNIPQ